MPTVTKACPSCGRGRRVALDTDGHGGVVEIVDACRFCARKKAGICTRCGVAPVAGKPGRALHCAPCRVLHQRELAKARRAALDPLKHQGTCRRCELRDVEGTVGRALYCGPCRKEIQSEKWQRRWSDPEFRARRAQQNRERRSTPEYRERKKRYVKNRILRNPSAVVAEMRRTNARPERIAARRRWAHENQTRYAGTGKKPLCRNRNCRRTIPFDGRGRPHKLCRRCDPKRWAQTDRRRARKGER